MPRPATCSRQCSSRSRSSAATRRRWAPRSARISTFRSTAARRPIGAAASRSLAIPPCRRRPCRWPASCEAPPQLARRLAQIGIVVAADAERLSKMLAPGQRLVSRDGALWRWDGMVGRRRRADCRRAAPGAEEPAGRARCRSLGRDEAGCARPSRHWPMPSARSARATEAERAARQGWRDAQHRLDAARDALQKAERRPANSTARRAALAESLSRLDEAHAEASGAVTEAAARPGRSARPDGVAGGVRPACRRRAARPCGAGRRARPP